MPDPGKRLHPATILVVFIEQARSLGAVVLFIFVARFLGKDSSDEGSAYIEIALAVMGFAAAIPAVIRYLTVRYTVDADAFTMTSGTLFRQKRVIPLDRIQNVSQKRNVVQRFLKVTTLEIETAGGAGAEAKLSVVSMADAEKLAAELQRTGARADDHVEDPPIYRATFGQIMLAGATQNKSGVILLFIAGLLNFAQELVSWERLPSMIAPWLANSEGAIWVAMVGIVLLLVCGWIVSIVSETVTNFGFILRRDDGLLRLSHGLFTQVRAALPVRRVQAIRIVSPVIQRMLGLSNVYAESAASFTEKTAGGAVRLAPIIEDTRIEGLISVVFPNLDLPSVQYLQVSPYARNRSFCANLLLGIAVIGGAEAFVGPIIFGAIPVVVAAAWYSARKRYRILGYARHKGYLVTRDGVWRRTVVALPENRVQWIMLTQGPLQRRLGTCSLAVFSAASGSTSVLKVPEVPIQVGRTLQDDLSYASASRAGSL